MTGPLARIVRLEAIARPAGCVGAGRSCRQTLIVGVGTLDPPVPPVPAICSRCARPVTALIVVLAGVDAGLV